MELQKESGQLPSHCSCCPWAQGAALATQERLFIPWTGCDTAVVWCSSCIRQAPAPVDFAFPSSSAPLFEPGLCWEGEGNFRRKTERKGTAAQQLLGLPLLLLEVYWENSTGISFFFSMAFKNTEPGCFRDVKYSTSFHAMIIKCFFS